VTALELTPHPAPHLYGGRMMWPAELAQDVMDAYRRITATAPDELTLWLHLLHFPGSDPLVAVDATYLGPDDAARDLLAPLVRLPRPLADGRRTMTVAELGAITAEPTEPGPGAARAELLTELDDAVAKTLLADPIAPLMNVQVRHLGGAFARPSGSRRTPAPALARTPAQPARHLPRQLPLRRLNGALRAGPSGGAFGGAGFAKPAAPGQIFAYCASRGMHYGRMSGPSREAGPRRSGGTRRMKSGMGAQTQEQLGPYRMIRKIGEGGMGVAHLGLDAAGREVAIKVLHPHVAADLKARDRLFREVETMRRVRSRFVAEVIDAELAGGKPYVVTRFAPGRTLEDTVLTEGPLAAHEVVTLAQGLAQALVDIHEAGVIHRDLKPSNVMLVGGQPLVIDFGIAHLVDAVRLTATGMVVGTPGYLAPEIIRASHVTQAADVHSLASTVFFAATGLPPFGTGTFESVCYNTMEGRSQIDKAPAWLRGWLSSALQVDPTARPDARELLRTARALDPASGAPRRPDRTQAMDTLSDLLPPVTYARPQEERSLVPAPTLHSDWSEQSAQSEQSGRPARWRRPAPPEEPFDLRRFLHGSGFVGVLMLVTLMALTVMNPVSGGLGAAALSLALRAADHYFAEERPPLSTAGLVTVGHLLLSVAFGLAAGGLLHMAGRLNAGHAESLAAGLFTLGLFVLPGAAPVRRAASGALARVLPGRSAIVVSTAVMGPITLIAIIVALSQMF
ncbi:serine/threonine-protein kinase, partial [Nonomuraea maheshkhaliensis]|uniref:serine/threonine-protein kinase n=1 Tax=Nonomuraea maheshkhaliensis TaxID=419590 RepID=UPI0031F8367F